MSHLRKATPFVVSTILHLAVLLAAILTSPQGTGNGDSDTKSDKNGRGNSDDRIVPKVVEVTIEESTPIEKGESEIPTPKEKKPVIGVHECMGDKWYGGIGIYQNLGSGEITEVVAGYAADRSGIKAGDVVLSGNEEIKGEPGTSVSILLYRPSTGEDIRVVVVREKICT